MTIVTINLGTKIDKGFSYFSGPTYSISTKQSGTPKAAPIYASPVKYGSDKSST